MQRDYRPIRLGIKFWIVYLIVACGLLTKLALAHDIVKHGYIVEQQFNVRQTRFNLHDEHGNCRYHFVDMHFHPRNFVLAGDNLAKVARDAHQACVSMIVINALPLIKSWEETSEYRPRYYADNSDRVYWNLAADHMVVHEWRHLSSKQQKMFVFLVNGFNHTDKNAITFIRQQLQLFQDVPIVGFGEIMGQHSILTNLTHGGTSRANHPALDPVYEFAAKRGWFVLLHNNIGNQSFQGKSKLIYMNMIKKTLAKHPNTTIILAHAGIGRGVEIANYTQVLNLLLAKYPNLYVDISWVVYDNYLFPNGKVNPQWIALIKRYPDRFFFGSDSVGGYMDDFRNIKKYIPFLQALPKPIADKVAGGNIMRLIKRALANPTT